MIVDSSALIAILAQEPERAAFSQAIMHANQASISAANYLETAIVVDGRADPVLSRRLDELVGALGIHITGVSAEHARIARSAYRDYGRGSGHPARLNFGDCFAYALASATGEPLLFKGDDFIHTDVSAVV